MTENVTVPDAIVGHVKIRLVFEPDDETKEAQESLVKADFGDVMGVTTRYNCWRTRGDTKVTNKNSVAWKGLRVRLRVLSPLYVLKWLIGANCVIDLLGHVLG